MKGVVFTEFLDMVEDKFTMDMVDNIIDDSELPSGGVYTSVGTYSHAEMVSLVVALHKHTGIEIVDLLKIYGEHLFGRFSKLYPDFFHENHDAFSFLAGIEDVIHTEVRKLYVDAELPTFTIESQSDRELVLLYGSPRHFEDLAEGLMRGCIAHFGGNISIHRTVVGSGDSRQERFILTR